MRSASVDLPWSIWAMIEKFRILSGFINLQTRFSAKIEILTITNFRANSHLPPENDNFRDNFRFLNPFPEGGRISAAANAFYPAAGTFDSFRPRGGNGKNFSPMRVVFIFLPGRGRKIRIYRREIAAFSGEKMSIKTIRHRYLSVLFLLGIIFTAGLTGVKAVTIYGVNATNQLVRFDSATPGTVTTVGAITGLQAGEDVLGIDFRPATGQLYALGSTNRLYVVNKNTGAVVSALTLSTALSGASFGFDFNPTVDRVRVVSNTGQNLRVNPNTGAVTVDGALNPGTPGVTAAAYTNSVFGATATTLYVIDTNNDTLYTQNPPNNGTLVSVGALGVNAVDANGFDIAPGGNTAYAALTVTGLTGLYTINLTTGAAASNGLIGLGATPLRGLAIDPQLAGSPASAVLDFDGDRKTDYAVFRLAGNQQFVNRSSNNTFFSYQFGLSTDVQTPGDFDGDGKADSAVWRPDTGVWYVLRSSDAAVQTYQFGLNGDEPVARDYDGDGKTDYAVVRRAGGQLVWYVNNSATNSFRTDVFGLASDVTAPGDYDGDGRFDLGTFRDGTFYAQRSTLGFAAVQWGASGDLVVPGDYDGDGKTDYAVVRQGTNMTWYILRSSDGGFSAPQFGTKPDFTAPGDYDGDGKTDVAVWRQSNGVFYVLQSSTGTVRQTQFGQNGDYPIANYDTH
ncbi:MAG: DUF4394 domain-containing protein [Acidobacteria bacterium]|nr:DUF4394 domain-containing protein [Acidobacteriota bacterium]